MLHVMTVVLSPQMTKHARKHTYTYTRTHTHTSSHQFRWYGWEEPAALMLVLMVLGILPMPVGGKKKRLLLVGEYFQSGR